jgi:uncharacterized protein
VTDVTAATPLVPGRAIGPVLALAEPLSLWGGVDPDSGMIVEPRHPDRGRSIAGHILVLPASRGSSSSSSILAELLRVGFGPRAIVLGEPDGILAVGAVVAQELYGIACPILLVTSSTEFRHVAECGSISIELDGTITATEPSPLA